MNVNTHNALTSLLSMNLNFSLYCTDEKVRAVQKEANRRFKVLESFLLDSSASENHELTNSPVRGRLPKFFSVHCQGYVSSPAKRLNLPPIVKAACWVSKYSGMLIKILLENGADPNAYEETTGLTAMHIVALKGDAESLRLLFLYGAKPFCAKGVFPAAFAWYSQSLETRFVLVNNQAEGMTCNEKHVTRARLPDIDLRIFTQINYDQRSANFLRLRCNPSFSGLSKAPDPASQVI